MEAEELALAKENATTEIQDYYGQLDLTKYTSENLSALNQIVRQALEDIDAATSVDQINTIVTNAKASMDAVEKIKEDSGNEGGSEEKKGCKGSIIASTSVIALISLVGLTFASLKRKED